MSMAPPSAFLPQYNSPAPELVPRTASPSKVQTVLDILAHGAIGAVGPNGQPSLAGFLGGLAGSGIAHYKTANAQKQLLKYDTAAANARAGTYNRLSHGEDLLPQDTYYSKPEEINSAFGATSPRYQNRTSGNLLRALTGNDKLPDAPEPLTSQVLKATEENNRNTITGSHAPSAFGAGVSSAGPNPEVPGGLPGEGDAPTAAPTSPAAALPAAGHLNPLQRAAYAAAQKHGINPATLMALLDTESGWNPHAVSPAGAQGIAQFMPATAKSFGIDPNNPQQAIEAAAKYLGSGVHQYGGVNASLANYNGGPRGAQRYQHGHPYSETANYIQRIASRTPYYERLIHGGESPAVASASPLPAYQPGAVAGAAAPVSPEANGDITRKLLEVATGRFTPEKEAKLNREGWHNPYQLGSTAPDPKVILDYLKQGQVTADKSTDQQHAADQLGVNRENNVLQKESRDTNAGIAQQNADTTREYNEGKLGVERGKLDQPTRYTILQHALNTADPAERQRLIRAIAAGGGAANGGADLLNLFDVNHDGVINEKDDSNYKPPEAAVNPEPAKTNWWASLQNWINHGGVTPQDPTPVLPQFKR